MNNKIIGAHICNLKKLKFEMLAKYELLGEIDIGDGF